MMGSTPEQFGPMTPQAFEGRCHPEDLPHVIAHLRSLAANPSRSGELEFRLRRDDGSWAWMLSRGQVAAFDEQGRSARIAGTLIEALSAPQRARVGRIVDAGQHLLKLINDLIDLSSIEAGMLSLRITAVDVEALLGECLAMVEPQLHQEDLHVECAAVAGVPLVRADALRLKQVLLNLLSNAIKYNRRGGWLRMDATAVDGMLEMSMANSGPGLDAEQLKGLFEPFNRLGQEAGAREGTGIGLAITRQLVEHMGGRIEASSELGAWTRFSLRLPLAT